MTRAEEAALKAYPFIPLPQYDLRDENPTDGNKIHRRIFLEGYEQAEKDIKEYLLELIEEESKFWDDGEMIFCGLTKKLNEI